MRSAVARAHAHRLLNHGPTVLVSAADGGRRNVMAAAWNMALDFAPPKVAVVIDRSTFTRGLVEASGEFVLSVPCAAQATLVNAIGSCGGRDIDKAAALCGLRYADASSVAAPLVEGCVGWLECRRIAEPRIEQAYDLFLGNVLAARADDCVASDGHWHFGGHDESQHAAPPGGRAFPAAARRTRRVNDQTASGGSTTIPSASA
jgi:flavin reductase (DIM6/NTAB) family NADH-FMN oxidoreductase RutF